MGVPETWSQIGALGLKKYWEPPFYRIKSNQISTSNLYNKLHNRKTTRWPGMWIHFNLSSLPQRRVDLWLGDNEAHEYWNCIPERVKCFSHARSVWRRLVRLLWCRACGRRTAADKPGQVITNTKINNGRAKEVHRIRIWQLFILLLNKWEGVVDCPWTGIRDFSRWRTRPRTPARRRSI